MITQVLPDNRAGNRKVKVVYKARVFYAHCPSCGRSRKCRHESDGTYTLVCSCRSDGADKIHYLIDAEEVHARDDFRVQYVEISDDEIPRGEEGLTL